MHGLSIRSVVYHTHKFFLGASPYLLSSTTSSCVSTFHADVKNYTKLTSLLFLCHAQGLTGVVVTPKELCLFSVLKSHPMKRNSRVSQHLLQGCMSWSNCIHTNYLFFTSSPTSYMMDTSNPTYLLNFVHREFTLRFKQDWH